jgi:hypothetical protein
MEQLDEILREATAAIRDNYFLLPIHYGGPVYRERVYCYELYHQMRQLWPEPGDSPYRLNGEVDKNNHPYFAGREGRKPKPKPDLLVHQPGGGTYNHAVIEVKSVDGRAIAKDLKTLALFTAELGYERAIFLIYGTRADARVARVLSVAARVPAAAPIEVWLHAAVGAPARHVRTLVP